MKKIDESDFKEFVYFPYIVIALTLIGLIVAFVKKRSLILVWLILIAILGILGLYDFYIWEYEYGHNLDPYAAIKVPGAAYQPPLLGKKEILNFVAESFPQAGAFVIFLSMVLGVFAWTKGKNNS